MQISEYGNKLLTVDDKNSTKLKAAIVIIIFWSFFKRKKKAGKAGKKEEAHETVDVTGLMKHFANAGNLIAVECTLTEMDTNGKNCGNREGEGPGRG